MRRDNFNLEFLKLDETSSFPLYRQIETQLRDALLQGLIPPGRKLPSSRQLADDLEVGRNTVINAYHQLLQEGYLETVKGAGTCVTQNLPEDILNVRQAGEPRQQKQGLLELSEKAKRLSLNFRYIQTSDEGRVAPFRVHVPASDEFPTKIWTQMTNRRLRQMPQQHFFPSDTRGHSSLRQAIADYLRNARGMACDPDQVFITAGVQQAVFLIARLLLDPGDVVCMEDPGYTPASDLFECEGAVIHPVPVDNEGICVRSLEKLKRKVKLVYVTPSAQFPLGMTLSSRRRLELVEWANKNDVIILEDDYNGEYRYVGRPLPPLFGMSDKCTVLYMGTFSKLLFPALRIGYVVVPETVVDTLAAIRWTIDRHSHSVEQAVLADFIHEGHFSRYIRKMRKIYARRQKTLIASIKEHLDGVLEVSPQNAGLHLIGNLCEGVSEAQFMRAAEVAHVIISPVSAFRYTKSDRASVLLGYAPYREDEIEAAVLRLREAIG